MDDAVPTLIYDKLVSERGDIPARVRAEAEEILRRLHWELQGATPAKGRSWFD